VSPKDDSAKTMTTQHLCQSETTVISRVQDRWETLALNIEISPPHFAYKSTQQLVTPIISAYNVVVSLDLKLYVNPIYYRYGLSLIIYSFC